MSNSEGPYGRFDPPLCPECGGEPDAVLEQVFRLMDVRYYTHGTDPVLDEVDWESSECVSGTKDRQAWILRCGRCPCYNQWEARYIAKEAAS